MPASACYCRPATDAPGEPTRADKLGSRSDFLRLDEAGLLCALFCLALDGIIIR